MGSCAATPLVCVATTVVRSPQVAHRAAVCVRPARPRLPTSTATTVDLMYGSLPLRKDKHTGALHGLAQKGASHTAKIGDAISRKVDSE